MNLAFFWWWLEPPKRGGHYMGSWEGRFGKKGTNFFLSQTRHKQVAQGQYVVSDTRCPALSDCELE